MQSGTYELQTWWFSTGATGSASFDEVKCVDDLQNWKETFFLLNFFLRYHVAPERDTVSWTWDQPHGFLTCFIYTACHWSTQVIALCCDWSKGSTGQNDRRNLCWKGWTGVPAATQTYRGGKGWPNAFRLKRKERNGQRPWRSTLWLEVNYSLLLASYDSRPKFCPSFEDIKSKYSKKEKEA